MGQSVCPLIFNSSWRFLQRSSHRRVLSRASRAVAWSAPPGEAGIKPLADAAAGFPRISVARFGGGHPAPPVPGALESAPPFVATPKPPTADTREPPES